MQATPETFEAIAAEPLRAHSEDRFSRRATLAHYERQAARAEAIARARHALKAELLAALKTDPQRVVMTPAFGNPHTAAQVVDDDMAGVKGAEILPSLLLIAAAAIEGNDEQRRIAKVLAGKLFEDIAQRHAEFHADDLVAEEEEAAS